MIPRSSLYFTPLFSVTFLLFPIPHPLHTRVYAVLPSPPFYFPFANSHGARLNVLHLRVYKFSPYVYVCAANLKSVSNFDQFEICSNGAQKYSFYPILLSFENAPPSSHLHLL